MCKCAACIIITLLTHDAGNEEPKKTMNLIINNATQWWVLIMVW